MKTESAGNDAKISVRDKILLTAHDLFYSAGFRATGVDTLIKASKVTKVTFYRHFPSKSYLLSPIYTIGMKYGLAGLRLRCVDILTKAKYLLMRYLQRFTNGFFLPSSTAAHLLMPAQRLNRKILKVK